MRVAIIRFLGTNCDFDCKFACDTFGIKSEFVWYEETSLKGFDCVILPGGFSYGDYLRSGALAKFSPILNAVKEFASYGGYVIGICNGFQILTESYLLPGALLKNINLHFIHKKVWLKVDNSICRFTEGLAGRVIELPIAHGEGNYYCDKEELKRLEGEGRVVLRYAHKDGSVDDNANPNGSVANIAGICNEGGNVFGLMPHPERSVGDLGSDGELIFNILK